MDDKVLDKFSAHFSRIGKQWGIGTSSGRVYGILLFSQYPLTQKEIAHKAHYSIGLVSKILKTLMKREMVYRTGSKKDIRYGTVSSLAATFEALLINFREKEIKPIISLLSDYRQGLKDSNLRKKIDALLEDYRKMIASIERIAGKTGA